MKIKAKKSVKKIFKKLPFDRSEENSQNFKFSNAQTQSTELTGLVAPKRRDRISKFETDVRSARRTMRLCSAIARELQDKVKFSRGKITN